jgi:cell division protein FtsA
LIDIGAGTTDISVYKSGKIIFSKVFDRGGEYLTDRIAFHLEIPTHKAEEMKLKHGTALENQANNEILKVGNLNDGIQKEISRRDLAKVIETHLSLLLRECLRIVQDGGFDEKIPAGFVFTGGTSNLEGIHD